MKERYEVFKFGYFKDSNNIFPIEDNKIMASTDRSIACFQIIGDRIELIFKYYCTNYDIFNEFYPIIYKRKYIFNHNNNIINVFSLKKMKYIFYTSFPHDGYNLQLFPLINGNLLLVYSPNSTLKNEGYSLMEVTFFQNNIYIVKNYEFKVKSIVAQLKDGTIIYNPPEK